jgi:hypothetical protein
MKDAVERVLITMNKYSSSGLRIILNLEGFMLKSQRVMLWLLLMSVAPQLLHAQQALDNAAVLQLAASGRSEEQIVQTIADSAGHYVLGTDALGAFKEAGVTDQEVAAMRKKNADAAAAAAEVGTVVPPGVTGVGVYYKDPKTDTWVQFKPEMYYYTSLAGPPSAFVGGYSTGHVVSQVASGVAVSAVQVAAGIVGPAADIAMIPIAIAYAITHSKHSDHNGSTPIKAVQIELNHPVDILIYAPEDTGPKSYHLLKLRAYPDNPDVRIFERRSVEDPEPSKRDRQRFTATKLGYRFYQFTLGQDYQPGEYGLLLPDAAAPDNVPGRGEIVTFRVVE